MPREKRILRPLHQVHPVTAAMGGTYGVVYALRPGIEKLSDLLCAFDTEHQVRI